MTRMLRKRATEFVTSDEMTLREFYGANYALQINKNHQISEIFINFQY